QGPPGPGSSRTRVLQDQGPPGPGSWRTLVLEDQGPPGTRKPHAKVTKVTCESHMRKLRKLQKLRKSHAKIRRRLFYGIARARACERKKNYKKGLQVSVNRAIMDSNKTSRHERQRRKKNHAGCV